MRRITPIPGPGTARRTEITVVMRVPARATAPAGPSSVRVSASPERTGPTGLLEAAHEGHDVREVLALDEARPASGSGRWTTVVRMVAAVSPRPGELRADVPAGCRGPRGIVSQLRAKTDLAGRDPAGTGGSRRARGAVVAGAVVAGAVVAGAVVAAVRTPPASAASSESPQPAIASAAHATAAASAAAARARDLTG